MRVLVTGAAGFIGSHAVERLLDGGDTVVGMDNFDPFYERALKESNLAAALAREPFTFVEADLRDAEAVGRVFAANGSFDAVLHLAARAGVRPSIADPAGYEQANVAGTIHLLDAAVAARPVPKFIFASSSSVYGNNRKVPFAEEDPVDRPISPYAATKKACELICHTYSHLYGLDVFCLRFFTVYGERQRPDLAIRKFARLMLAGQPVPMYGEPDSGRDYTYIADILDGVTAAVRRCRGYEVINLGSSRPILLGDMIRTVAEACGVDPRIECLPAQPGDVQRTFADTAKAERLLDYRPTTDFAEGVRRQVAWMREHEA
jgi:UDP-glucuronate 4-epimerase